MNVSPLHGGTYEKSIARCVISSTEKLRNDENWISWYIYRQYIYLFLMLVLAVGSCCQAANFSVYLFLIVLAVGSCCQAANFSVQLSKKQFA